MQNETGMMQNISILVVDDSPYMVDLLAGMLVLMGYTKIIKAKDGESAVNWHKKKKIDLTFLDIEMLDMNGLEALEQIKARRNNAYVVMVSAHNSATNVKQSLNAGAKGFIVKPYSGKKIKEAVDNYKRSQDQQNLNACG